VLVGFVLWYSFERGAHQIQPLDSGAAIVVDENPCACQLCRLWCVLYGGGFGRGRIVGFAPPAKIILPAAEVIDEIMYKAIAVGFLFFTIATVLGALWAADAWGRYWSGIQKKLGL
jgi:ABC-type transport system involved in cytochrome c biogenesis permease subunit